MRKELSIEFSRNPFILKIRYDGKIIKKIFFENQESLSSKLHLLETKNDREIYDWCKGVCIFLDEKEND